MIQRSDLLTFHFYKKEKFTGSFCGMRYLIQKAEENDAEIFEVFTWPGPYNFAATPDNVKIRNTFPFTEDSLHKITDYLNEIFQKAYPPGASRYGHSAVS